MFSSIKSRRTFRNSFTDVPLKHSPLFKCSVFGTWRNLSRSYKDRKLLRGVPTLHTLNKALKVMETAISSLERAFTVTFCFFFLFFWGCNQMLKGKVLVLKFSSCSYIVWRQVPQKNPAHLVGTKSHQQGIGKRAGINDSVREVKKRRWKWLGHVLCMKMDHHPYAALTWVPPGKRVRDRALDTWRWTTEAEMELEMDNWGRDGTGDGQLRQRWRKPGRTGMNSSGLPKTGLGGGALLTPFAPLGAKRIEWERVVYSFPPLLMAQLAKHQSVFVHKKRVQTFTYPLTTGVVWGTTDDFTTSCLHFSVLQCPLGLGELQACPLPSVVFLPLLLSALYKHSCIYWDFCLLPAILLSASSPSIPMSSAAALQPVVAWEDPPVGVAVPDLSWPWPSCFGGRHFVDFPQTFRKWHKCWYPSEAKAVQFWLASKWVPSKN